MIVPKYGSSKITEFVKKTTILKFVGNKGLTLQLVLVVLNAQTNFRDN